MINVAIVLGYWLNDDGTMAPLLKERLELFLKLDKQVSINKVIVSGGIANQKAGVSEAQRMMEYLVAKGYDEKKIIIEDKSGSTVGNAKYSVPIAKELGANNIYLISSNDHFTRYSFNPIKIFSEAINDDNIGLFIYTNTISKVE